MSLRLGDIAPDFEQDSSAGKIRFHEWLGDSWGVLFSPSGGLHSGVHHRAGFHRQAQG
jgi:hypothetical protein